MSQRFCVCGKSISIKRQLCGECLEIYGDDPEEWPAWLKWQTSDIQREVDYERRHDEFWLDDEDEPQADFTEPLRGCRTETHLYQDRTNY
jgi:hypothetical protein